MRIAGRMKMGYYPTPERVVEQIRKCLSFPREPFTALDPCCGEGLALEQLLSNTQAAYLRSGTGSASSRRGRGSYSESSEVWD